MSTINEPVDGVEAFEQIIPRNQRLAYGLGALGKDLGVAIVFLYTMFFMIDVVGLNPAFVGGLMLFARIFDAFTDPAMGLIVDNTRTRWGKFRPWVLIGAVVNSVFIVALFTVPSGWNLETYFAVAFILWGITYTINDISYWSMLPTLATGKRSRERLAVIPRLFAAAAWWLLGTFGILAVAELGNGDDAAGFRALALIMAVAFVGFSLVCVAVVRPLIEADPEAEKTSVRRMITLITQNDQLLAFLGAVVLFNMIIQIAGGMALFYFTDVVGNQQLFAVWQGFGGLTQMAGLFMLPAIAKRLPRPTVYGIASFLPVAGLGLLFLTNIVAPGTVALVAVASILLNLGVGFFLGISVVMLADVVDYGEYKFGTRNESVVFSVQPMLVKFAAAFAGAFVGFGLGIVGYNADLEVQSDGTKAGMTVLMIGLPIACAVLGFIIYQLKFKLNGEFHEEVLRSLAAEREVPTAGGYPL
jgi:melibiose permease